MADSTVDGWAPSSDTRFRQKLEDSISQLRGIFATGNGSRGRRRIATTIVLGLMLLFSCLYNLKEYYTTANWWYNSQTGWIVSLVLEIVLSLVLLAVLSTIVLEFFTSAMVASAAVGIYIAITFLVDSGSYTNNGRCMASWSVAVFWIAFVIDAPFKLGYHLTDLLARNLVAQDTGRIRLPERNEDATKFRYTPSLQATTQAGSTSSASTAGDVDLEGASQFSGRTYAAI